jgi:hypothetical protein
MLNRVAYFRARPKIPKAKYRVTNWPEYDAALVQRGSLTVWVIDDARGMACTSDSRWCMNKCTVVSSLFRFAYQRIRMAAGMPSLVIRFNTLYPIFASVF